MISVQFSGIDQVISKLEELETDQINRVRLACIEIAHMLEQSAITNHPWQVRTQLTNITTHGTFEQVADDLFEIVLSAGSPYSKYLELAGPFRGAFAAHLAMLPPDSLSVGDLGPYAWIWPAIVEHAQEIEDVIVRHLQH